MTPQDPQQQQQAASPQLATVLAQLQLLRANDKKRMKPMTYRWRSWIEGPRGTLGELMKGASTYGLRLTVENHDRRWFRETVVFEVRGTKAQVDAFGRAVVKWTEARS